ncbi:MAG: bifunctional oligoribonuclease/PAP phosphatase NrnA [Gemmiger sp.]|nr:bifunctional oligoribonuclease/PAP phosphatase NrnA [Gemmiger sp.]
MTESVDRQTAAERLRAADDILILCHKNPDGDTVGSAGALYQALCQLGKTAAVLCSDPIPAMYSYMPFARYDGSFEPAFVVAVDVASIQLFGEKNDVQRYVERADLCIDHHGTNSGYAYATLLDDTAAATCELLTEWMDDLGVRITPDIANCLYTGVATDTGCFRFTNTTARTHLAAARLIAAGADIERLNEILFESRSHPRVEAEKLALESLQLFYQNRCALICLTWDQISGTGVAGAELEDLTSLPRSIEGVQVGLTLRQQPDGSFKISVRTDRTINACAIARRLGGGGHPRAAGCEISGNLENAKHAILEEVKKELDKLDQELSVQEQQ